MTKTRVEGDVYGQILSNAGSVTQNFTFQQAAGRPSIPMQLPPPVEHFTGREAEISELLALLYPGQMVTLWGSGGMGKTAVSSATLFHLIKNKTLLDRFPDGVIFYSFYGRSSTENALEHIIRTYDETATQISHAAAFRCLAGKKLLLLLDGAEEADDLNAILKLRGQCGLFLTTRDRAHSDGKRIALEPLSDENAATLLNAWLERPLDPHIADQISQLVGRLPLALRLVSRYLDQSGEPAADYLAALQASPIQELSHGDRREDSIAILLQKSVAQLSSPAQTALAVMGRLAYLPFTQEPIAAALDVPPQQLRPLLAELFRYGLLQRDAGQNQLSHALIHTYARRRLDLLAAQLIHLATYYDSLARVETKKGLSGYQRLHPLRPHIMQVHSQCARAGQWEAVRSLTWAIDRYLNMQGFARERLSVLTIGLKAARHLSNRRDEGAFLIKLGTISASLRDFDDAINYLKQALPICRELNHKMDEAGALGNLGNVYIALGDMEQAINYYQKALFIDREIGHHKGEANQLSNLGLVYSTMGKMKKAIIYINQALRIHRKISDRQGEAEQLGKLGLVYRSLGYTNQAIEFTQQALLINREIGYQFGIASDSCELGIMLGLSGEIENARQFLHESLKIFVAIQSPYANWARQQLENLSGTK